MSRRSSVVTRGWPRSRGWSWPCPTSTATTWAAPAWSRQSVNPPVDAPASRARRPVGSRSKRSRAARSLSPPRLTKRGRSPRSSMGSAGDTSRAGLSAMEPETSTTPRAMSSTAWGRLSASFRATSARSRRWRAGGVSRPTPVRTAPRCGLRGRRLLGGGLLGRGLLGCGLLGRSLLGRCLLGCGLLGGAFLAGAFLAGAFLAVDFFGVGARPAQQRGDLGGQVLEVRDADRTQLALHLGPDGRRRSPRCPGDRARAARRPGPGPRRSGCHRSSRARRPAPRPSSGSCW